MEVMRLADAELTTPVIFVPQTSSYSNVTMHPVAEDAVLQGVNSKINNNRNLQFLDNNSSILFPARRSRSNSPVLNDDVSVGQKEHPSGLLHSNSVDSVFESSVVPLPPINLKMTLTTNRQQHLTRNAPTWQRSNSSTTAGVDTTAAVYTPMDHYVLRAHPEAQLGRGVLNKYENNNNRSMARIDSKMSLLSKSTSSVRSPGGQPDLFGEHDDDWSHHDATAQGMGETDAGNDEDEDEDVLEHAFAQSRAAANAFSKSLNNYDWNMHGFRAQTSDSAELLALTQHIEEKIAQGSLHQVDKRTQSARDLLLHRVQVRTLTKGLV